MIRRKLSRRMFLHTATGAALALPLLNDFDHDAQAASGPFKRFIVIFTPNGQITQSWLSSGSGASFKMGEIYASAFADFAKDVTVIHNLDMSCAMDGMGGDAHGLGIGCMLTGTELLAGDQFQAGMGGPGSGWPGGISVDQYIANKVGTTTKFKSLEFSMKRAAGTIWTRMSYAGSALPVTPYDDPQVAFDKIFGDIGVDPAVLARRAAQRQSVLDGVTGEFNKLSMSLSGSDKTKVDQHLAAIRTIESQLSNTGAMTGACTPPARPTIGASAEVLRNASGMEIEDPNAHADVPQRQIIWRQLMTTALSCDLTRVASFIMAPSRSDIFLNWLTIPVLQGETAANKHSHHDYSHINYSAITDGTSGRALIVINQWYAQQIANIVKDMKAIKEGAGTMFDNTVILWCNELGEGQSHSHTNIPFLTIGNASGSINTGQSISMPQGTPHNSLMISLINAMGISDASGWGNPKHNAKGPIPNFVKA
jgi:hypothetical protein